jgi:hypothetical protein
MSLVSPRRAVGVPGGPRALRYQIRRLGALAALVPPAVLALGSVLLLRHNTTTTRGVAGFGAAVLAAPALMPFGVPLATGSSPLLYGSLVSVGVWLAVGLLAARRATRAVVAGWRDFWREFAWLAAGIWLGVVLALVGVELIAGRGLV